MCDHTNCVNISTSLHSYLSTTIMSAGMHHHSRITAVLSHLQLNTTAANSNTTDFSTADLCDKHPNDVHLILPFLHLYGTVPKVAGQAYTLKTHEDNGIVRSTLETPGNGRILVVDGGGSWRCALVGDQLADLAIKNKWAGILVHGCIRDSALIQEMAVHIRAIGTSPVKSIRRQWGVKEVPVQFEHGVEIKTGDYIYSDADGVLVSSKSLLQ